MGVDSPPDHSISVLISVHQWLEKIHSPEPQATLSIPTKPQTTSSKSKSKSAQRKSLSYRVRATPSNRIHIRHQRPNLPLGASQTPPCVFFARCAFVRVISDLDSDSDLEDVARARYDLEWVWVLLRLIPNPIIL
jgi:hypothetical protein